MFSHRTRGNNNSVTKTTAPYLYSKQVFENSVQSIHKTPSSRNSNANQIEQERLYLGKANDQLRRCQIALFRYQKHQTRNSGVGSVATNRSTSLNLQAKRDRMRTQGDFDISNPIAAISLDF